MTLLDLKMTTKDSERAATLVCIAAAGTGSRLGSLKKGLSKAMIEVGGQPAISRIINQFPSNYRFIVAVGHNGSLLIEYLTVAHPDTVFDFVPIQNFEGEGSGLGLSLLSCEAFLQAPFIFTSCDTLVLEKIPSLDENWAGYAVNGADDTSQYRTLSLIDNYVDEIKEKSESSQPNHKPYIGLAGIKDFEEFWSAMKRGGGLAIAQGESFGLNKIVRNKVRAHPFTWFDTGSPESLEVTRRAFKSQVEANILEKDGEAIWFVNNHVIKYSASRDFIQKRVSRSVLLQGYVPEIINHSQYFYRYKQAPGIVFSDVATIPDFALLMELGKTFWSKVTLTPKEYEVFKNVCRVFYRDKTLERVTNFFRRHHLRDTELTINGLSIPSLQSHLEQIDWNYVSEGIPCRFHGDFHFENILYDQNARSFTFLDWRQDFGGNLSIGDVYYDLAKLLHGLLVNHRIISMHLYKVDWEGSKIQFDLHRSFGLEEVEHEFYKWVVNNGYDKKKIDLICSLVFLNIAAMHHSPYDKLLYSLGRWKLAKSMSCVI